MIAHVTTPVELIEVAVFAELAVWSERPALAALCRAAVDAPLDEAAIDRLLPGLPLHGRRNLLRHLDRERLVARDGSLTALGQRCAESGEAPAWEQGVYRLLVARHRLIGCEVLDFERAGTDGRDRDFDGLTPLPRGFVIDPDRVFTSALDETRRFGVAALPVVVAPPARHAPVRPQRAGVRRADRHRERVIELGDRGRRPVQLADDGAPDLAAA